MSHDPSRGALPLQPGKRAETIEEALLSRRSLRAFRPDPVPRETVARILALASRAPSGTNVQPWKVHAAAGAVKERIAAEMVAEFMAHGEEGWKSTYAYYPTKWRVALPRPAAQAGLGPVRPARHRQGRRERTKVQHARNFRFFDAPVALLFTIDEDLEKGSWLDYGMFLQSVMLAARAFGLDTCPQAAIARAHEVLRRHCRSRGARWWCAACRSAMRATTRSRTGWSRNASR